MIFLLNMSHRFDLLITNQIIKMFYNVRYIDLQHT